MHSVFLVNDNCPNAYWNGTRPTTARTSTPTTWSRTNGVTHTRNTRTTLIYSYQSGALNESYSDIFGETLTP